jgi:hypothetical protein
MILSHFLYRREEDVPYIYVPQDKFYHIVAPRPEGVSNSRGTTSGGASRFLEGLEHVSSGLEPVV